MMKMKNQNVKWFRVIGSVWDFFPFWSEEFLILYNWNLQESFNTAPAGGTQSPEEVSTQQTRVTDECYFTIKWSLVIFTPH